jgi:hypothetical protein
MKQNVKQKNPNPQGKGLVPVLAALANASAGIRVLPKHVEQVSTELFTALFILESQFSFKPVRGREYWLYRYGERFKLSLVTPEQWSVGTFDQVIGCCELHDDLTWTLTLSDDAAQDTAFIAFIAERRERFQQMLHDSESLAAALPVYQQGLPFYQRVFASALASSLGKSMQLTGIASLRYEQARVSQLT